MESERRKRKRLKKKRRIIILICVVFISIFGYFLANNQFVRGLYYKIDNPLSDKNAIIEFEEGINSTYTVFDNVLISYSKNGICGYNLSGEKINTKFFEELSSVVSGYNSLKLKKCNKYICAYDNKGRDIVIFNLKKIISNTKTASSIILAKPLDNGEFIVIAEDKSAKNQVIVFDNSGKEEFIWHSGVNNVVDAAYSYEAGKLTVVSADLSTGILNSKLSFFDISSNTPYSEITVDDVFITNINYFNDNNMLAVSDKGIYYFNVNGEMKNSYSYNEKMLSNYSLLKDGTCALSFRSNSNETLTEIVNKKGKLIGSYNSLNEVVYMDTLNDNILLCETRKVSLITKRGFLLRETEYTKDLKQAYLGGRNKIVLISNSELRIIN